MKPSKEIQLKIKDNFNLDDIEELVKDFDKNYIFDEKPPQVIIDVIFGAFISGAMAERYRQNCCDGNCASCENPC